MWGGGGRRESILLDFGCFPGDTERAGEAEGENAKEDRKGGREEKMTGKRRSWKLVTDKMYSRDGR